MLKITKKQYWFTVLNVSLVLLNSPTSKTVVYSPDTTSGVAWIPQAIANINIFLHFLYVYIFIKPKKKNVFETLIFLFFTFQEYKKNNTLLDLQRNSTLWKNIRSGKKN